MNFKLRQLEGFTAAARCASFSRAAAQVAMTQPAFSQMIRELETTLGVRLFERTTRRVELTDAGRVLLSRVQGPLEELGDAYASVRDIAQGRRARSCSPRCRRWPSRSARARWRPSRRRIPASVCASWRSRTNC